MSAKLRSVAGAGALAAVLLVAGGGASAIAGTAHAASAHQVAITANPTGLLKYTKSSITTTPGKVTIVFTNNSPLGHDVVLINSKNKVLGKTPIFASASAARISTSSIVSKRLTSPKSTATSWGEYLGIMTLL